MTSDINLLTQKTKGFFSEERLLLFVRIFAIVLVIVVLSLSILFFFLSKDPSITQQNADKSQTLAQLTLLHDKTAKYLIVIDRLQKIQAIQQKKVNLDKPLITLVDQVPANTTIASFTLDQKSFALSISSSDLSLLGQTVSNFRELITSKNTLKDVTIQGILSDEKGQKYVLTLTGDLL